MLFLGRTIIFSLLCLFSLEFLLVYQREKSTTAATARVAFSLFLSLFYSNALMIKRTTGIENYPYTERERERERGKKAWFVSCVCVCVCDEMWDDRQKEIQKKYEEGENSPLFFGVLKLRLRGVSRLTKIKRTQKKRRDPNQ